MFDGRNRATPRGLIYWLGYAQHGCQTSTQYNCASLCPARIGATIAIACKRFFVAEHLVRRSRAAAAAPGRNRENGRRPLLSQLKSYTHRGASRFLCILHMYIPIPYCIVYTYTYIYIFIGIRNDCVPMRQRLKLTVPEQPAC